MARDPVCGTEVKDKGMKGERIEYAGKTYHFCSPICKIEFEEEPDRYVALAEATRDPLIMERAA
jgi:Cu+-exporting ATPase